MIFMQYFIFYASFAIFHQHLVNLIQQISMNLFTFHIIEPIFAQNSAILTSRHHVVQMNSNVHIKCK